MKKLFASLMALAMMVSMMTGAMAYTAVKPNANQPAITHTLTLTDLSLTKLPYEITYSFDVTEQAAVAQPSDIINPALAVSGAPIIADLVYSTSDEFDSTTHSCTKNLVIDWSNVNITEPGVFYWTVTKTMDTDDPDTEHSATNLSGTMYLYAYVIENGGNLTVNDVFLRSSSDLEDETAHKGNLNDQYPIEKLSLSINKTVTGNQGSKDQYFCFTVTLKSPVGAADQIYSIQVPEKTIPATAYHAAKTNPENITVPSGSIGTVEIWLKHGQTATISGLLFDTSYTIIESANTGYTVTTGVSGDAAITTTEIAGEVTDPSLTATTTVAYNNFKEATVPTGIIPMSGAPIMMMLAAAVMMMINKRKAK